MMAALALEGELVMDFNPSSDLVAAHLTSPP
jgi:hypothetical protein